MERAEAKKTYTIEELMKERHEGWKEAEAFLQERVAKVCVTNHKLLKEIMSLDRHEPVAGVVIPYSLCEAIVEKLRDSNKFDGHAQLIKTHMYRGDRAILKRWKRALKEMKSG